MFSKIKIAHCEIQIRPLVIQNRPVKAAKFETDAAGLRQDSRPEAIHRLTTEMGDYILDVP
jgi:hypothetical protein